MTDEAELIQKEVIAAKEAVERYYDLNTAEYREQRQRLAAIEDRLDRLEHTTALLERDVQSVLQSKIWKTLVRGGKLIAKVSATSES